jgi:hypothetical protein
MSSWTATLSFLLPPTVGGTTHTSCEQALYIPCKVINLLTPGHPCAAAALGLPDRCCPSRSLAPSPPNFTCRNSTPPCHHWRPNDTAETHRHSRLALRHTSTAANLSDPTSRVLETWPRVPSMVGTSAPTPRPLPLLDTCFRVALNIARQPHYKSQTLSH